MTRAASSKPRQSRSQRVSLLSMGFESASSTTRNGTGAEDSLGEVTYYKKERFSKNAGPGLIGQIAAGSDVVITAIGD